MSALAELRNVVRGIAPTILADRGLDAALSAVVQRTETSDVPTTLDIHLPVRLPEEVEACAYFVVAEALTNVARHADATQAVVTVRTDEAANTLHVSVFDDEARRRTHRRRRGFDGTARPGRAGAGGPRNLHAVQPRHRPHDRHGGAAMRIVIAEDSALLRAGIERILADAGHEIVAGVPDATELLRIVNDQKPDLAILDVRMPPTFTDEGIRPRPCCGPRNPDSPVLVLPHCRGALSNT